MSISASVDFCVALHELRYLTTPKPTALVKSVETDLDHAFGRLQIVQFVDFQRFPLRFLKTNGLIVG